MSKFTRAQQGLVSDCDWIKSIGGFGSCEIRELDVGSMEDSPDGLIQTSTKMTCDLTGARRKKSTFKSPGVNVCLEQYCRREASLSRKTNNLMERKPARYCQVLLRRYSVDDDSKGSTENNKNTIKNTSSHKYRVNLGTGVSKTTIGTNFSNTSPCHHTACSSKQSSNLNPTRTTLSFYSLRPNLVHLNHRRVAVCLTLRVRSARGALTESVLRSLTGRVAGSMLRVIFESPLRSQRRIIPEAMTDVQDREHNNAEICRHNSCTTRPSTRTRQSPRHTISHEEDCTQAETNVGTRRLDAETMASGGASHIEMFAVLAVNGE